MHYKYDEAFSEKNPESFWRQIEVARKWEIKTPYFFFMNVSVTHIPYMGNGLTVKGQAKAVGHFDTHLPGLLKGLPKPLLLIITADHGDALPLEGDGIQGHNIHHPKVFEVPMDAVYLKEDV